LGQIKQLEKKISNLKAFYIKATKDKVLDKYSKVNLQFGNQVVCTKA
jgi:cell division protein FtsQ